MCSTELSESIVSLPVFQDGGGMPSFIAGGKKETWEAFSSTTPDRSSETKGASKHPEADAGSQSLGRRVKTQLLLDTLTHLRNAHLFCFFIFFTRYHSTEVFSLMTQIAVAPSCFC